MHSHVQHAMWHVFACSKCNVACIRMFKMQCGLRWLILIASTVATCGDHEWQMPKAWGDVVDESVAGADRERNRERERERSGERGTPRESERRRVR